MRKLSLSFLCIICISVFAFSQAHHDDHEHDDHMEQTEHADDHGNGHGNECGHSEEDVFNPQKVAFHHISDQNIYSIGPFSIPLPCILKSDAGWEVFSSGKFKADYHGTGEYAFDDYVLFEGSVRRIVKADEFPDGLVELGQHKLYVRELEMDNGKKKDVVHLCYQGKEWLCDSKSYADGGFLGGGNTSFYDFSITKNVMTMILVFLFLGWALIGTANAYKKKRRNGSKRNARIYGVYLCFYSG